MTAAILAAFLGGACAVANLFCFDAAWAIGRKHGMDEMLKTLRDRNPDAYRLLLAAPDVRKAKS